MYDARRTSSRPAASHAHMLCAWLLLLACFDFRLASDNAQLELMCCSTILLLWGLVVVEFGCALLTFASCLLRYLAITYEYTLIQAVTFINASMCMSYDVGSINKNSIL